MKLFLPLTLLLIALTSTTAFADHLYLVPNEGNGDNFAYFTEMNGHRLVLGGGLEPAFFGSFGYQPGLLLGGSTELFLDSTVIWIGGSPTEFFFPPGVLFMTPFTLPTTGKSFKVPVDIAFFITGYNDTGQTIDLSGGASGSIYVDYFAPNGLYYPDVFVQAPEPATLELIGTGLMGIAALVRKRLRTRQAFRDR